MPVRYPKSAGKPYRPSNGTEGDIFMEMYCDRCAKREYCVIPCVSMAFEKDDPEYPKEWLFGSDGVPICTAIEEIRKDGDR